LELLIPETNHGMISEEDQIINLIVKSKRLQHYVTRTFNKTISKIKLQCFEALKMLFNDESSENYSMISNLTVVSAIYYIISTLVSIPLLYYDY